MDIWRIISTVQKCKEIHDNAKSAYYKIKESYTQTEGVYNDTVEYYQNITTYVSVFFTILFLYACFYNQII